MSASIILSCARSVRRGFGIAAMLALPVCLLSAEPTTPDFSGADALIQKWIDGHCYPGAGLWIVTKDGRTLHEKYWGDYNRNTVVMIASSSKWLEAATAMTLVDAGKFDLDKPISTWLPEMKGPQGENTLRQMFSHTSSLNWIDLPGVEGEAGIDRIPALLAAGHTQVKPGEIFHYGGTALATASRAVEVVMERPWLTVFARNIAKPCHMKSTITGHNLWTFSGIVGGDNFPCSNARDYMNFLLMLLNDGTFEGKRVLSSQAIREMQADQVGNAKVDGEHEYPQQTLGQKHHGVYGLGEWRLMVDDKGEAVVLSSPSFAGFFPWIDKKHGIAGVFVGRATGGGIDAFRASAALVPLVNKGLDDYDHQSADGATKP